MVKWWQKYRDLNIKKTKARIAHMEKHGMGAMAVKEKARLQKMQRHNQEVPT